MAFSKSGDVILRSGFIQAVAKNFQTYYDRMTRESISAVELHTRHLRSDRAEWASIRSSETCLVCIRRIPQYRLPCHHVICENCIVNFGRCSRTDPYLFLIETCYLCRTQMPEKVLVRIHPPTAGAGVLCIDGGGVRGVVPLQLMQRISDQIGVPIPFQRFFRLVLGISSGKAYPVYRVSTKLLLLTWIGGLIAADLFLNGCPIEKTAERFEQLASTVFENRHVFHIPLLSKFIQTFLSSFTDTVPLLPILRKALKLSMSYYANGIYPPEHIEEALTQVFGKERTILDVSHATSTGTLVGLPVATASETPSRRIFTNYNGIGQRPQHHGMFQKAVAKDADLLIITR